MFNVSSLRDYLLEYKDFARGFIETRMEETEDSIPSGWPDAFPRCFVIRPDYSEGDGNNYIFSDDQEFYGHQEATTFWEIIIHGPWCRDDIIYIMRTRLLEYTNRNGDVVVKVPLGSTASHIIAEKEINDKPNSHVNLTRLNFNLTFVVDDCDICLDD